MYISYNSLSKKAQEDLRHYEKILGSFNGSYCGINDQIILSPNCFVFIKTSHCGTIKNNQLSDGFGKSTIIFYNEGNFSEYSQIFANYKNGRCVNQWWNKEIVKLAKAVKEGKSVVVSFLTVESIGSGGIESITFFTH